MRAPNLVGVVERRLLVNYRADPDVTARVLPAPLRPQLVNGWAVAGICLLRLGQLRPRAVPAILGTRSENAAHRIAVEWDTPDGIATGVYIPRRDTGSVVNVLVGGNLFPGTHHRAWFDVDESPAELRVGFTSADRGATVRVHARVADELTGSHLFADAADASEFFRRGSVGYSVTAEEGCLDGLELRTDAWRVDPVEVVSARSSFFDDGGLFPPGSATLDCALVMRDVPVTWHPLPPMRLSWLSGHVG
jgi:hypothetical protein